MNNDEKKWVELVQLLQWAIDKINDQNYKQSTLINDNEMQFEKVWPALTLAYSPNFRKFWAAYPRKVAKGDAWKAWKALKPGKYVAANMIAHIEIMKKCKDWTKEGGTFIPYPATWLRDRRWEDELNITSLEQSDIESAKRYYEEIKRRDDV